MGKYSIILADPPWEYETWSEKGAGRSTCQHYDTMTLGEICKLDVGSLAANNCALFLWAVWPSIFDAQRVAEEWGFRYATRAWVWVKTKKHGFGIRMGMGNYTRANTEPCLLAVRGKMPVAVHDEMALIYSPVRAHSRKPDEQYTKIARLYPEERRLELFARRTWPGWDVWGNEVESDVRLG